jgi:hypothetical protein
MIGMPIGLSVGHVRFNFGAQLSGLILALLKVTNLG